MILLLTFLLTLFFTRPIPYAFFFALFVLAKKNAQNAPLGLPFFAVFVQIWQTQCHVEGVKTWHYAWYFSQKARKIPREGARLRIFPFKRKGTGKMLREKGRVKNKVKRKVKSKIKTLGAIPQTPFFF
ncbi:MAG: hypothetical protein H7829_07365 [Magnetococcus sp. THC-1_WYH]